MYVNIDNDTAVEMLMDRLEEWTTDCDTLDMYREMYESYVCGGGFGDMDFDVNQIVDNDWVNYCTVYEKSECSNKDWAKLINAYEDGYRDISCEEFEDINGSYIEAMSEDRTKALIRC